MKPYEIPSSYNQIGMEGAELKIMLDLADKNEGLRGNLFDWPAHTAMCSLISTFADSMVHSVHSTQHCYCEI